MAERKNAGSVNSKVAPSSKTSRRKGKASLDRREPARSVLCAAVEIEAKPVPTVECYLLRLASPQRELVEKLLRIARDAAPRAKESIQGGHPLFEHKGPLCSVIACTTHVSLGFFAVGCSLSDPDRLLEGIGECTRHVKFRSLSEIRAGQLAAWIRKAVEFNEDA